MARPQGRGGRRRKRILATPAAAAFQTRACNHGKLSTAAEHWMRVAFQSDGCKELALTCLTTCSVVFSRHGSSLMGSSSSRDGNSQPGSGSSSTSSGSSSGGGSGGGGSGGGGLSGGAAPVGAAGCLPSWPPHVGSSTATAASFPTGAGDSSLSPSSASSFSLPLCEAAGAGAGAGAHQGSSPGAEGGALPAARPDPRLHHTPTAARWWPLAVRFVRVMLESEHTKEEYWVYHSSRVLHLDGPWGQPSEPSEGPGGGCVLGYVMGQILSGLRCSKCCWD